MTIQEVALKVQELTGCEIETSNENEDKRNYIVSAQKIKDVGFNPNRNFEYAFEEIKNALQMNPEMNYIDVKYNNYKFLSLPEMRKKVFI